MLSNIAINNISYDWRDIEIVFVGDFDVTNQEINRSHPVDSGQVDITQFSKKIVTHKPKGVTSINYGMTPTFDYGKSRGGLSVSRKFGMPTFLAEITMSFYELDKINSLTFDVYRTFVPMDVKIIYNIKGKQYIDTLYGCQVGSPDSLGGSQGDIGLEANITLDPVWIKTESIF